MKKAVVFLLVSIAIAVLAFVGFLFYLDEKAISAYNEYVENSTHIYFIPE